MKLSRSFITIITLGLFLLFLIAVVIILSIQGSSSQPKNLNSYRILQELKVGGSNWRVIESDSSLSNISTCSRSYALTQQRDGHSTPEVIHEICDERERAGFSLSTNLSGDRPPVWPYDWSPKSVNVEYALTLHNPENSSRRVYQLLFAEDEEVVRTYDDRENDYFSITYPNQHEQNVELTFANECMLDESQFSGEIYLESIALRDVDTEQITSSLIVGQDIPCFSFYGETSPPSIHEGALSTAGVYFSIYPDVTVRIHQGANGELPIDIVSAPWIGQNLDETSN